MTRNCNKHKLEFKESHIENMNTRKDIFFSSTVSPMVISELTTSQVTLRGNFVHDGVDDGDDQTAVKRRKTENGTSHNSNNSNSMNEPAASTFVCEICVHDKSAAESFAIQNCSHSYCRDCINKYVASKIQQSDDITRSISCPVPDCKGSLDLEYCRQVVPPEVIQRWETALDVLAGSQRWYCPFKDCSTMLIDDGTQVFVTELGCPKCKRILCAHCKVPWHAEISCQEFQALAEDEREKEDIMLRNLACKSNWSRCPRCKFYVERTEGCDHIECRCGKHFNYLEERQFI